MRCVAQGHIDTQLGGAGDQRSNLSITGHPALPPKLLPPLLELCHQLALYDPLSGRVIFYKSERSSWDVKGVLLFYFWCGLCCAFRL